MAKTTTPVNHRQKLIKAFNRAMLNKWTRSGPEIVNKAAEQDPLGFLRIIASMAPKEIAGEGGGALTIQIVQHDPGGEMIEGEVVPLTLVHDAYRKDTE